MNNNTSNPETNFTSLQIREISKAILQKPSHTRNQNDIKILQMATSNIKFFEEILREEGIQVLNKCLSRIQLEVYPESTIVFEKGDKGKDFYIIFSGQVGIYIYSNDMESFQYNKTTIRPSIRDYVNQLIESGEKPKPDHPLEIRKILVNEKIKKLFKANELHEGDSFGERALINEAARLATVVCETACTFGVLNKQDYKEILLQAQSEKIQKQITELQSISSFSSISRKLLTILLYAFQSQEFKFREIVYKQGSENKQEIYLIQSGEFVIQQDIVNTTYNPLKINCQGTKQVAILIKGSIFGDKEAFLNHTIRTQTVRCNSDSGKVLCIHLNSLYQRLQANNELHLFNELKQQCEVKEQTRQIRIEKKQQYPKKSKSFFVSNSPNSNIDNIIQHKKAIVKYLNKNEKEQAQFIFDIKIPRARTPGGNAPKQCETSFQQPRRRSAIERVFLNSRVSKRASEDLTSQCNRFASKRYSFL